MLPAARGVTGEGGKGEGGRQGRIVGGAVTKREWREGRGNYGVACEEGKLGARIGTKGRPRQAAEVARRRCRSPQIGPGASLRDRPVLLDWALTCVRMTGKIGSWILVGILLVGPRLLAPPMCDVSNGRRAQDYVVIGGLTKAA